MTRIDHLGDWLRDGTAGEGEESNVAVWPEDAGHPFLPEGPRDKLLLRCPEGPPFPRLISGHRYLFKQSRKVYPEQFWLKVIASRSGRFSL